MNKAFIEIRGDHNISSSFHVACQGLNELGYETIWFTRSDFERGLIPITKDTLVVGYIETYRKAIANLGLEPPINIDFPEELMPFLGRKVFITNLRFVRDESNWPIFAKPLVEHKLFTGKLIKQFRDLLSSAGLAPDLEVWASEPVRFISEYRCFIQNGQVLSVRPYKGDPLIFPDGKVIQNMVAAWTSAPRACCIDVGISEKGETLLVEVNDGFSMGDYGLSPIVYARMLEARWCELTGAIPIP